MSVNQDREGDTHDSRPVSYQRPADRRRCGQTAVDFGRQRRGRGRRTTAWCRTMMKSGSHPRHLVALQAAPASRASAATANNIRIGAMITQNELLASDEIAQSLRLHENGAV